MLAIVTNRHVVQGAEAIEFVFRRSLPDLSGPVIGGGIPIQFQDVKRGVLYHPDDSVDLCIIPLAPLIHSLNTNGEYPWFGIIDRDSVNPNPSLPLRAIENVLMVGYPIGLWDDANDMPIVRRGITATHPALNWRGRREFLIDAACFPGSSGSPIWLVREGLKHNVETKATEGFHHTRLLGILYAGPQFTVEGQIKIPVTPRDTQGT